MIAVSNPSKCPGKGNTETVTSRYILLAAGGRPNNGGYPGAKICFHIPDIPGLPAGQLHIFYEWQHGTEKSYTILYTDGFASPSTFAVRQSSY